MNVKLCMTEWKQDQQFKGGYCCSLLTANNTVLKIPQPVSGHPIQERWENKSLRNSYQDGRGPAAYNLWEEAEGAGPI